MKRLRYFVLLFLILCGCTKMYKPAGPAEQNAYDHSRKDVTLNQFRHDPVKFSKETLAWTGILKKVNIREDQEIPRGLIIKLLVEQRGFSWIWTTRSALPAGYLISSSTEGNFEGTLKLQFTNNDKPLEKIKKEFLSGYEPGCFVIIYGRPQINEDKTLGMRVLFSNFIPSSEYFTEKTNF